MRLIVTFVIGHLPWSEPLIKNYRDYASQVGADFLEVKWFPECAEHYHGNPNWSCVEFLKKFALQDYYTEVLMIDCDVMFLPSCPNLFEIPGGLVCSPDQAWPTKDTRYKNWLERNYPSSPELHENGKYFNAGVLLFRLDAVRMLDLEGPYPDDYANDQDFLNMRVGEAGVPVSWQGYEFNQREVWNRQKALSGNHVLHFVGNAKSEIEHFARFL